MAYKKPSQTFNTPTSSKMADLLSRRGFLGFKRGDKVEARIISISGRQVFLDLGGKSEGIVEGREYDSARDFIKGLSDNQQVSVTIVSPETRSGSILLSLRGAAQDFAWESLDKAIRDKVSVLVNVMGIVKSGISVDFFGINGFIPMSQIGESVLSNLEGLVGQQIEVRPIEVDREKNRALFSEREISEKDKIEKQKQVIATIKPDEIFEGEIVNIAPFGVFVRIFKEGTPIEGLVHSTRLGDLSALQPGDALSVRMMSGGRTEGKVAFDVVLSDKDISRYKKDEKVSGRVVRMNQNNAVIEIEPGVNGMSSLSSLPAGFAIHIGESHDFFIEDVDPIKRRITLGLALKAKPVGYK